MPDTLELDCPAKVNLTLSIASPLANGYHPLASWMVAVAFADQLRLARAASGKSSFHLAFAKDAPMPGAVDWPIEKDLAFRAHRLLEERAGRSLPVELTLTKHIPAGAGLGGGSSDAAATLVGVDRLYELRTPLADLKTLATKLGSDVAFLVGALNGEPSSLVTGLGESLEALPIREVIHLVLILPGFGCPTGEVYRAFDTAHPHSAGKRDADAARVRAIASRWPVPQDAPFNDLAEPACAVRPQLRDIRDRLTKELGIPVHITGSGSTLFVIAPTAQTAKALARKVTAVTGLAAVATRTRG